MIRGMIKWKPFNTLIKSSDIILLAKQKEIEKKPIIAEDKIESIDYTLKDAIRNNLTVEIKYWKICELKLIIGKISKINLEEKYILINNFRIYFKNVININIVND